MAKQYSSFTKTVEKNEEPLLTSIDKTSLDDLMKQSTNKLEETDHSLKEKAPYLFKIKIRFSEALKMLNYVKSNGYTTASIFPGYNGVARECNEQLLIRDASERLNNKK